YDPHFPYNPPESFRKLYPKDLYAGEVAYVDQQIGRLLSSIQTSHSKTLVVLTADHGESLGEHLESTHSIFAYESTLRIPLIIAPFAHSVVTSRVRSIDIAPTILDLQKLAFSNKVQGVSLQSFLKNPAGKADNPQDSYFEALSMQFSAGWAP